MSALAVAPSAALITVQLFAAAAADSWVDLANGALSEGSADLKVRLCCGRVAACLLSCRRLPVADQETQEVLLANVSCQCLTTIMVGEMLYVLGRTPACFASLLLLPMCNIVWWLLRSPVGGGICLAAAADACCCLTSGFCIALVLQMLKALARMRGIHWTGDVDGAAAAGGGAAAEGVGRAVPDTPGAAAAE
jgi:hypothetical protein